MQETPEITREVRESGLSRIEAQKFAGLNPRTVKKIFDGEPVSSRTAHRMRLGLVAYRNSISQFFGESEAGDNVPLNGSEIPLSVEDALMALRKVTTAYEGIARLCLDGARIVAPKDGERLAFEINKLVEAQRVIVSSEASEAQPKPK